MKRLFISLGGLLLVVYLMNIPTLKDATEKGFETVEELKKYKEAGFDTKKAFVRRGFESLSEYEKHSAKGFYWKEEFVATGFESLSEYEKHSAKGFSTKKDFVATGFESLSEYLSYEKVGFKTKQALKDSGFKDIQQALALSYYGSNFDAAVSAASVVSFNDFNTCDTKDNSYYENYCQGKTVVWHAIVGGHSSDGVRLNIIESCDDQSTEIAVDALGVLINKKFSNDNKEKCIQVLARIGDKNFSFPDISVERVLSIETQSDKVQRVARLVAKKEAEVIKKLAANKTNGAWLFDVYGVDAHLACKAKMESEIAWQNGGRGFRWTAGGWGLFKYFGLIKPYVIQIRSNNLELQSQNGTWIQKISRCDYNVKTDTALNARWN